MDSNVAALQPLAWPSFGGSENGSRLCQLWGVFCDGIKQPRALCGTVGLVQLLHGKGFIDTYRGQSLQADRIEMSPPLLKKWAS